MTEDVTSPDAVTKVARDLSEILNLSEHLEDQATHKANDPEYLPGGDATVALAPVASIEAWEHTFETAERLWVQRMAAGKATKADRPESDEDEDWEPPLQTLLFWSEGWRREHNRESDRRPTIPSEVAFIRQVLNWAYENEPRFDDFARDINRARVRLENLLYAGKRAERMRVPCTNPTCETQPRLIKVYGATAAADRYKCPHCKASYDQDEYERAYAKQMRSEGAERFVKMVDAIGTLRAQGRSERTIRQWFADCLVEGYCDPVTHEVWVWWPTLWTLHSTTKTRQRTA